MCGILAQLGHSSQFFDAVKLIEHRGIRTRVQDTKWGLVAHARLPIVGVDTCYDQPVTTDDRWTIAFVGEVLDFREYDPGAECDLRTVVHAVTGRRGDSLDCHDGFWSVVALDDYTGELHCFVDYLAQKPLYYREDVRAVASEPYALTKLSAVTPDEEYFAAVAKWGYCPHRTRTPYVEIKKMLPGWGLVMTQSGKAKHYVVDPLRPVVYDPLTPLVLKLEIEEAVRRRVTSSDVPMAILYSGGLDSSIVRMLAERHTDNLRFYCSDVGRGADDAPEHARVVPSLAISDHLDVQLRFMQEPVDLGSLVPQISMSCAVKESVCLTGDGADELFGGYSRASRYDSQASDVWDELCNYHLPRLDRVMMRNRVEVRSPFLSRRVCEIALGLPWELRRDKKILRDLFRDDLPRGRADEPKVPLRTREVEQDREARSLELIAEFRRQTWRT